MEADFSSDFQGKFEKICESYSLFYDGFLFTLLKSE